MCRLAGRCGLLLAIIPIATMNKKIGINIKDPLIK